MLVRMVAERPQGTEANQMQTDKTEQAPTDDTKQAPDDEVVVPHVIEGFGRLAPSNDEGMRQEVSLTEVDEDAPPSA